MEEKTKKQLLEELADVQKMLEERTAIQGQMIKKFQMLISNEGLFSQIIDYFPYPIAIFTPQYTLAVVNKAFEDETKTHMLNPGNDALRVLPHKGDDTQLVTAVSRVFAGKTCFLEDLKNPFSMFAGVTKISLSQPERFQKAVVFPVSADDAKITHGVVMYMP